MWRDELSIEELEMIAENELIEIIPNFKRDEINLISVNKYFNMNIGHCRSI